MATINWEQAIRDAFDETNNAFRVNIVSQSASTTNTRSKLDYQHCWILSYDNTNNALQLIRIQV